MPSTAVYRLRNVDGELLYVGCSGNLSRRLGQHKQLKAWWSEVVQLEITKYPGKAVAREVELQAIHEESPKYNVRGRPQPRLHRTCVALRGDQKAWLVAEAKKQGRSVGGLLRQIIEARRKAAIERQSDD